MSGRSPEPDRERSPRSPFRGLNSFSASDADAVLFFGRDRERELILANLLASRLTLLYGQSGIGKSSILCAGVVNALRDVELDAGAASRIAVVYISEWHAPPETTILAKVGEEAQRLIRGQNEQAGRLDGKQAKHVKLGGEEAEQVGGLSGEETEHVGLSREQAEQVGGLSGGRSEQAERGIRFDQALKSWEDRLDARLLLIFDQFEQYFLHHPPARSGAFDRALADAIVRPDLRMHCLISLREDALVGLDRFKGEIPNLFGNRLRLGGLSEEAALEAITGPVARYNERREPGQGPVELEQGLARRITSELQNVASPLTRGRGAPGGPVRAHTNAERLVEPAHLQIVMEALWREETRADSRTLRNATLTALGGCDEIVRTHVEASLAGLPPRQRAIAARAIRYLITPSGAKVAHTAGDLADYADASTASVAEMLECLCDLRVMRPLPPLEGSRERRYEVFHDLLAEPMLEWRAGVEAQRLGSRMRWLLAALSAAVAAALAIAAYNIQPTALQHLELRSVDTRFAVRGTTPPDHDIVIVDVDKHTLEALNGGRPGEALRPYYAKLIDLLLAGKPKVIGLDVEFRDTGNEGKLLDAIKRADGRIVLVSERFDSEGAVPLFGREEEGGATSLLRELNNAQAGFGGFPLDAGAVYRRMQYSAPHGEGQPESPLLSFSAAVARIAEPHSPRRFTGSTLIDYHGPPHTFASVPMIDVLHGLAHASLFADKIVVVGVSAPAGKDLHRTPFTSAPTMPGAEIQANAISTVRHGPALRTAGAGVATLLIIALSLAALLVAAVRWWVALAVFAAVAGAYTLLVQLLFDGGLYLPLVYPLLALALAGLGTLLARIYLAPQNRTRRRATSGRRSTQQSASAAPPRLEEVGAA